MKGLKVKVPFFDLKDQYKAIKTEVDNAVHAVLDSGDFVSGPFVASFEKNFAALHEAKYCVAVSSGTSALHIAMWALDIQAGDEVLVPTNTFIASAAAINMTGATPVFVDCDALYNIDPEKIEKAITKKTKAILVVHLYGQPAQMDKIKAIAEKHKLMVIEDCAQAHEAAYKGKPVGALGICGCFSFYPSKNLGAYGEGGAIVTNDEALYKKMLMIREHGSSKKYFHDILGHNYRMQGLQGAILDVKLKHLGEWTEKRRELANLYRKYLRGVTQIVLPEEMKDARHVYHLFVIRTTRRDELIDFLKQNEIYTGIHYPIPCHLQKCYHYLGYKENSLPVAEKYAKEILSLPMYPELTEEQIEYTANKIKEFFHA